MRQVLRQALPMALAGVLLAGCGAAHHVAGQASPGAGEPVDVAPDAFPITGASDTGVDQLARNALADLNAFWTQAYPEFFGEDFTPLQNGYFSVDSTAIDESAYPATGIGCEDSPTKPDEVAENAYYDPSCDLIAYDRALLEELSTDYGRFLGPVVMAHEFGHAMQSRFGFAASGRSIQDETQADCFAGAWTGWVRRGKAEHVSLRTPELDDVIRGFLLLRDDVGSDPNDSQAHGSYFDRVSAFYEGFDGGVGSCRDDFGEDRLYTAASFRGAELETGGNATVDQIDEWVGTTLPEFWTGVFPSAYGTDFTPPKVKTFDGSAPDCAGVRNRDLGYCADDKTVYLDETDLARPAYDEIGDFALTTAMSLPYSLAVRDQAGLSVDDGAATRSAVCLTGWYEAQWFHGAFTDSTDGAVISPGDIDEAVQFLLEYGVRPEVFPNTSASGFELVGAFRTGFLQGGDACDLKR
ncbi:MAG: neutral zinc metallopeptidase [Blastococcus sp.]